MSSADNFFCEVLLPLPLPLTYTYRVPREWVNSVQIGQRVVVSLGKKKMYCGIIYELHNRVPKVASVKYIISILDQEAIVSSLMLKFWKWIADYYMCYMGEVMMCSLPSSLRLKSESTIVVNPDFDGDITNMSPEQLEVFDAVSRVQKSSLGDVIRATNIEKIMPLVSQMIREGYIETEEELKDTYRPKMQQCVSLSSQYQNEEALQNLFDSFAADGRKKKQYQLLMLFFQCAKEEKGVVNKADLLSDNRFSASAFSSLIKANIFEIEKHKISRLKTREASLSVDDIVLNDQQQKAYDKIVESWIQKPVSLIFGVTGSGKTEIYIKLIERVISQGQQALFLLPEIALTVPFIQRLEKYFGSRVGVYHSRYSKEERTEIFEKVRSINTKERYDVIIGSRSAIFLPFVQLGLIIVDEENDSSYKQYDSSPRYNARDCAMYLASLHGAKTVLGSATPSIETFFNAQNEKYQLLELTHRYFDVPFPEIIPIDIKQQKLEGKMKGEFSDILIENITLALQNKQQVLLFQNRRGFSRSIRCEACGQVIHCTNCDVALTYHKQSNELRCHYCGLSIQVPEKCPHCGSYNLRMVGFGTEKIEEMLSILFPQANVARLDLDTTRQKTAYSRIINSFANKEIDIMVGTQMITKGLDFSNVGVVAIMDADGLLCFPDFRSTERSFSQMTQVAGRAGRRFAQGRVFIQTLNPQNEVIKDVVSHSYVSMYEKQILERRVFKYPPYYRLIKISLQDIKKDIVNQSSEEFATELKNIYGGRILGPQEPLISRIRNRYIMEILIKVERQSSIKSVKAKIMELVEKTHSRYSSIRIAIDVDPV